MSDDSGRRPPPYSLDRAVLARQVRIDVHRATGPGGQHVNRTESAVRVVHFPSGVTVTAADTRSQIRNREIAFDRLIERLIRLNHVPRKRKATRPTAGARKRRLEGKRHRAGIKQGRGRVSDD